MLCMICLEEGADEFPPCQNSCISPRFHKKCLEMAMYAQEKPKCPHCNQPITVLTNKNNTIKMEGVKHKIESIMQRWLQDRGCWIKGPEYIQVNDFLMYTKEAEGAIAIIGDFIEQQLTKLSSTTIFFSKLKDQDAIVYRHRETTEGIETDVLIRRTAIFNDFNLGSFRMDGYTISMSRTRYSPRHYRQPCIFDGKDNLFIS